MDLRWRNARVSSGQKKATKEVYAKKQTPTGHTTLRASGIYGSLPERRGSSTVLTKTR